MAGSSHCFADRIVNIAVTGPLVRLELAALVPPAKEGDKSGLQPTQSLVMPLDGFLAAFGMLETVVKKMLADGVLKPKPAGEAATSAEPPPARQ